MIRVDRDDWTPRIRDLARLAKNPRGIMAAGGRALRNFLVRHFRRLDRKNPNKLGGPRTHFWLQVSRSTQNPEITDRSAVVTVSDPRYPLQVYGGRVEAKRVRMLTIPVSPEAHGRSADVLERELGIDLVPIGDDGRGILAEILPGGRVKTHYVLRPWVIIDPFPDALPKMNLMAAYCFAQMESAAARQSAKN